MRNLGLAVLGWVAVGLPGLLQAQTNIPMVILGGGANAMNVAVQAPLTPGWNLFSNTNVNFVEGTTVFSDTTSVGTAFTQHYWGGMEHRLSVGVENLSPTSATFMPASRLGSFWTVKMTPDVTVQVGGERYKRPLEPEILSGQVKVGYAF